MNAMIHDPAADEALLRPALTQLGQGFAQRVVDLPHGVQIAIRECGQRGPAPSIVLLHGISSGAATWLQPALLLGKDHHVVAWDAPGYGDSTSLPGDSPSDTDYAERLDRLLQALRIERCMLVAHSLGALMACAYARDLGRAKVERLVLISPAGGYGAADRKEASQRVRSERRSALQTLGVAGIADRISSRLLSAGADAASHAWVRWNAARLREAGYRQAIELLCNSDLAASRGLLAMPVEIHCGEADGVTPPAACRGWADVLAAPFATIAGAGHASPVEQAEAVARLLAAAAAATPAHTLSGDQTRG